MQLWRSVLAIVLLLTASVSSDQTRTATVCNSPGFVALNGLWAGDGRVRGIRTHRQGVCEFSCNGGRVKRDVTKKIYIPATSRLDWREYRSRLIRAETPAWMRRASQQTGVWAHEVFKLEQGCLLIETGSLLRAVKLEGLDLSSLADLMEAREIDDDANCDASSSPARKVSDAHVILLLSHDAKRGSRGLILNKATPCTIGDFTKKLPHFQDNTIHYGGDGTVAPSSAVEGDGRSLGSQQLHTLHSCREIRGSEEIVDGVFLGADVTQASLLVSLGRARPADFKFFYSALDWEAGQLEAEMAEGKWVAAACSKELILKTGDYWQKPLWRLVLEVMGGKFALMSRYLSSDL
mmetsp:Transcript_53569/g.86703  ORF Transcript_53569/g.86703 Transcript_53569/m.86703 type:complete len:350 (-) Transcript_53569:98-1147(-)